SASYVSSCRCFGAPRDLHSFPTRRSSDLTALGRVDDERPAAAQHTPHVAEHTAQCGVVQVLGDVSRNYDVRAVVSKRHVHGIRSDRKSTRLNSSHVKISYAVFCLKKKIQA